MMKLNIIILAAGQSKRMHTSIPKVLHPLAGIPLLQRVVNTAQQLNPEKIYVIYGNGGKSVSETLKHLPVKWIEQKEQLGTGHAVMQALPFISDNEQVLVLYGDVPLISSETLHKLLKKTSSHQLGVLVTERENPSGYGRIIRDLQNHIIAIIEQKDATPKQQQIREINTGILTASAKNLKRWLPKIENKNSQKEYYLTDAIALAVADNCDIVDIKASVEEEVQGVNDRTELARLERYCQWKTAQELMLQGVTLLDPQRLDVRGELKTGKDVVIDANVIIEGKVKIGNDCRIGIGTVLRNVKMGNKVIVKGYCMIEEAEIADECEIGPFTRIRPGTRLEKKVHLGNFVEVKNSQLGENTKANHLSYLGDAVIGNNVNVGCGVITCNYDGVEKHRTIIKDGAFIGSDSQLVAPVTVGENAYIGSGSTITKNAPDNKLTISRAKQTTIENWTPPKKKK